MAGTLTASAGATSFRFVNDVRLSSSSSHVSTPKVYVGGRNAPKASLHAVIDAEPAVESPTRKPATLYDVLRVKRNASPKEIKTAYRSLAKLYHPDASDSRRNNDRDFIDIHNAYATLSDPSARALYDLKLSTGFVRRSGGLYTDAGNRSEFYTGRRWETDQCW